MFLEGSKFKVSDGESLKKHIDAAGLSQTILCSDLGQVGIFSPLEGFRRGMKLCMDLGYDDNEIPPWFRPTPQMPSAFRMT